MATIGGDIDAIRAAAQALQNYANELEQQRQTLTKALLQLTNTWEGRSRNMCVETWNVSNQLQANMVGTLQTYAAALSTYADQLDAQRHRSFLSKLSHGLGAIAGFAVNLASVSLGSMLFPGIGGLSALLQAPSLAKQGFGAFGKLAHVFVPGKIDGLPDASNIDQLLKPAQSLSGYSYRLDAHLVETQTKAWFDPRRMTLGADGKIMIAHFSAAGSIGNEALGASGYVDAVGLQAHGRVAASWDPTNPYAIAEADVVAGRVVAGGEVHTPLGRAYGDAAAEVLAAHAGIALRPGELSAGVGVSLATVKGHAGIDALGQHWGVGAEIGMKAELGFSVGERTEIRLPLLTVSSDGPLANLMPGISQISQIAKAGKSLKHLFGL